MNDARPSKAEPSAPCQGAQIIAAGAFPSKLASVCAEVLARLLNRERLTCIDAVSEASTTRLSAVVHYLVHSYGWSIEATSKATGCRDGRVSWVAEYSLSSNAVDCAMARGGANWCAQVRVARLALRAKAADARRSANRLNACRKPHPQTQQWGLFDGERAK